MNDPFLQGLVRDGIVQGYDRPGAHTRPDFTGQPVNGPRELNEIEMAGRASGQGRVTERPMVPLAAPIPQYFNLVKEASPGTVFANQGLPFDVSSVHLGTARVALFVKFSSPFLNTAITQTTFSFHLKIPSLFIAPNTACDAVKAAFAGYAVYQDWNPDTLTWATVPGVFLADGYERLNVLNSLSAFAPGSVGTGGVLITVSDSNPDNISQGLNLRDEDTGSAFNGAVGLCLLWEGFRVVGGIDVDSDIMVTAPVTSYYYNAEYVRV